MQNLTKHSFRRIIQPTLAATILLLGIVSAISFYLDLELVGVGILFLISTLATLRNWLYFSTLDADEIQGTQSFTPATPWLLVACLTAFLPYDSFSPTLVTPNHKTTVLLGVSFVIGFLNVWLPHHRRKTHFREQRTAATIQQNVQTLRRHHYANLGEGIPVDWNSLGLTKERRVELMNLEILAIQALNQLTQSDSRPADTRRLLFTLAPLATAFVLEFASTLMVKWIGY